MTGKQLKNSILQWAIQGKLVPQDPNDEPASVLLEKIRQEKERLIKEKKIKRDKNASIIFRGEDNSYYEKFLATGEVKCIDEEIPFEIPQGWEWERLGNIFETASGSTPMSKNPDYYKNGDINWVRTTDLNNGILDKANIQITTKACSDYNLTILPLNSVCVAMYGGAGTIGKHSILRFYTTINQSVCAIIPNGLCNMDYIHAFIEYQRPYWMDFAAGSRKDPNINQLIIKHCLLPIPPLKEQSRIVEKHNLLSPLVNLYDICQIRLDVINKEIWKCLRKSILQEAIQGKLVPQIAEEGTARELLGQIRQEKQKLVEEGKLKKTALTDSIIYKGEDNRYYEKIDQQCKDITEEIPFEIPENWEWCRLGNIISITSGDNLTSKQMHKGTIPVYGGNGITGYHSQANVFEETIVIGRVGFYCGSIHLTPCKAWVTDNAFITRYNKIFNRSFLITLLTALDLGKSYSSTAQPVVSGKKIYPILVALPPLQEQQRIVAQIERLFEQLK